MTACLGAHETKPWVKPEIPDGKPTIYGWVVRCPKNFVLAPQTDIGHGVYIQAKYNVVIEEGVMIGAGCKIYSENTIDNTQGPVIIRVGAKVGANSVILPNVTIGAYAKIGALSLVKTNIPEKELWVGVPAQKRGVL